MLVFPIAVFLGFAMLMNHISGRDELAALQKPGASSDTKPLNSRWDGYSVVDVAAYWGGLAKLEGALSGKKPLEIERRFLELDLIFPLAYGGALMISLLWAWGNLGKPFTVHWLLFPVVLTMLADWVENLTQLHQLSLFQAEQPLQKLWIQLASVATVIKLHVFVLTGIFLITLMLWICKRNT